MRQSAEWLHGINVQHISNNATRELCFLWKTSCYGSASSDRVQFKPIGRKAGRPVVWFSADSGSWNPENLQQRSHPQPMSAVCRHWALVFFTFIKALPGIPEVMFFRSLGLTSSCPVDTSHSISWGFSLEHLERWLMPRHGGMHPQSTPDAEAGGSHICGVLVLPGYLAKMKQATSRSNPKLPLNLRKRKITYRALSCF